MSRKNIAFKKPTGSFITALIEIAIILAWAVCIGREYVDLSPVAIPAGREFWMGVQSNFSWHLLKECGGCFFWNGFANGGAPAFVDVHGAWLHPLVAVPALLYDVLNGAKITLVLSLMMAGIAQWWLCKVFGIRALSRVWSSLLVVASGHLAGKMEMGLLPLVTSVASCSLVIPPAIDLALNGRCRTAILLACTLALAFLSGQAYVQIGLLVTICPAVLILLFDHNFHIKPQWKFFLLAGFLSLLLVGFFAVPLLHFGTNMAKDLDPNFGSVQPLKYAVLNLVIDEQDFYHTNSLAKLPYPYLYINYIGWIPVILAICTLAFLFVSKRSRLASFFTTAILLVFLASTGSTFKLLQIILPNSMAGIRNPSVIASLAIPLIATLAALGIDVLLQNQKTALTFIAVAQNQRLPNFQFNSLWVIILPMLLALSSVFMFSSEWMLMSYGSYVEQELVIAKLKTPTAQWIQTPYGEHAWLFLAMNANLKIADYPRPWHWKGREKPWAYLASFRIKPSAKDGKLLGVFDGIFVTSSPENEYAFIRTDEGNIPCTARARGGNIDVDCNAEGEGTLIVHENSWSGWYAQLDGKSVELLPNAWLSTQAPAGIHHFEFRYRPWDVPLGTIFTVIGIVFVIWLWWKNPYQVQETEHLNV